jgi:hypothetical protein
MASEGDANARRRRDCRPQAQRDRAACQRGCPALSSGRTPGAIGLAVGERPVAFSAVTRAGAQVAQGTALRLVGFFWAPCSACQERVPPFLEYLSSHGVGRASALAVVVGGEAAPPPYLECLGEFAQICMEEEDGQVGSAFKVTGYPAFCLLGADGAVLASRYDPADLPEPVKA